MNSIRPLARYCISVSLALACAAALAMHPPPQQIPEPRSASLSSAYLDCARIASGWVLEPDLVTLCSMVADVLIRFDPARVAAPAQGRPLSTEPPVDRRAIDRQQPGL